MSEQAPVSTVTDAATALVEIYAVPGTALADHAGAIGRALQRAIVTRADGVAPPGHWQGVMLPRDAGRMNFDPNGLNPHSAEKKQRIDWQIGAMGGQKIDWRIGSMGG